MGLIGQMLAGGIAGGADSVSKSIEQQGQADRLAQLERSRQGQVEYLKRLEHGWNREDKADERTYQKSNAVIGVDAKGIPVTREQMAGGATVMNPKQWEKSLPMSTEEKAEHDAKMGLIGVQLQGAKASLAKREDMRGEFGKRYDDLVRAYGPEKGAALFEQLLSKGDRVPMSDAQRTSAYNAAYKEYLADPEAQTESPTGKMIKTPGFFFDSEEPEKKRQSFQEWIQVNRPDLVETVERGGSGAKNNVGGMRPVGQSTGFQSFGSVEESLKAVDDNLKAYGSKHGINTLEGVISRWSPKKDGNNTEKLIAEASRVTGFKPDQKIDLGNPAVRAVISAAIIRQEGSSAFLDGIGRGSGGQGAAPQQIEELPIDVSRRTPGTVYRSPANGRLAMWDGAGLIPQDGNSAPLGAVGRGDGQQSNTGQSSPVPGGKKPDPAQFGVGAKQQSGRLIGIGADNDQAKQVSTVEGPSTGTSKEKPWYEKELDVGAAIGKPMAAIGGAAGEAIAGTISALAEIKKSLTEAEYQKAIAYAQTQNVNIGPIINQLGVDGFKAWLSSANPAKNTEQYMQRTSSKNLNQYFR